MNYTNRRSLSPSGMRIAHETLVMAASRGF